MRRNRTLHLPLTGYHPLGALREDDGDEIALKAPVRPVAPVETPRLFRHCNEAFPVLIGALALLWGAHAIAKTFPLWVLHSVAALGLWVVGVAVLFLAVLLWESGRKVWHK